MGHIRIVTNHQLTNLEIFSRTSISRFDNQFKGNKGNRNSSDIDAPIQPGKTHEDKILYQ